MEASSINGWILPSLNCLKTKRNGRALNHCQCSCQRCFSQKNRYPRSEEAHTSGLPTGGQTTSLSDRKVGHTKGTQSMSSNFTTLEASYRIVTPMFCAGADQQKAELRLASFKGALRFWWRSMMGGKVNDVAGLHQKEAEIFGSSDQKIGQSKVRMRLINDAAAKPETSASWTREKGIQYLGYGVMNFRGVLTRPMIPGGTFTVQLRLAPNLSDEQREQVQNALILLGSIGGMGSKSRKGFGSLTLTELKKNDQAVELSADPIERIKSSVGTLESNQPDWTAWSKGSRIVRAVRAEGGRQAVDLLDKIGREQVHFRSWGRKGDRDSEHKVLGNPSEKNFEDDHDLSKPGLRSKVSINHPQRIAFGLPHNYGKPVTRMPLRPQTKFMTAGPARSLSTSIRQAKTNRLLGLSRFSLRCFYLAASRFKRLVRMCRSIPATASGRPFTAILID